ncbi:UNVERIFIED_CONTAM: hypothetical protein RMT77_016658 [Armadillidium vulgare]
MKTLKLFGFVLFLIMFAFSDAAKAQLVRPCFTSRDYTPLCGTDCKTYANHSVLRCAKRDNPELRLLYYGPC